MTTDEEQDYGAIIHGKTSPPAALVAAGHQGHADGKAFHENPHSFATVEGLCWRIGWNNRAIGR